MDPKNFVSPDFGQVAKEPGNKHAFWYFHPAPIPRELALDAATVRAFVTVATVQRRLDVSDQTARNLIKQAEGIGWLEPVGRSGRGGRSYWVAGEIFAVIDAPVDYAAH